MDWLPNANGNCVPTLVVRGPRISEWQWACSFAADLGSRCMRRPHGGDNTSPHPVCPLTIDWGCSSWRKCLLPSGGLDTWTWTLASYTRTAPREKTNPRRTCYLPMGIANTYSGTIWKLNFVSKAQIKEKYFLRRNYSGMMLKRSHPYQRPLLVRVSDCVGRPTYCKSSQSGWDQATFSSSAQIRIPHLSSLIGQIARQQLFPSKGQQDLKRIQNQSAMIIRVVPSTHTQSYTPTHRNTHRDIHTHLKQHS